MGRSTLLIALLWTFTGQAQASESGYLTGWLSPRPKIENYQDREAFVADILLWQRERDQLAARAARGELPPLPAESAAEHDPDDWHTITGPEDLETAVRNASGYQQPNYSEPLRFNRTTHISFPLESLASEDMSDKAIDGALGAEHEQPEKPASAMTELLLEDLEEVTRLPPNLEPPLPALSQTDQAHASQPHSAHR
ncbi:hypothetical protein [Alcanivorax sp. 1008]|uniref:hypothetical protein n=1 Tax=Alcanivorax sp. 1008 TaxID=2816853 RepID=UPI001D3D6C9F|nr:hypothetical protein [Alcanivorax sp. 1008]MCC1496994.1 hypothetical protein [Alcanivorax sp. 1008]